MAVIDSVALLNGRFHRVTLAQTVAAVSRMLQENERGWLCTVNVAILMMMRSDPRLQRFAERASLVVADGQPLIWYARWLKCPLPERVTGVDLLPAVCELAARLGRRVYLLGATRAVVSELARQLSERYPGLRLEFADGYFSANEAAARADQIRRSSSDILFVGMGVPRQEYFLEEQWDRLGVGVAIGVGGSFDVLAGLRARAPRWMQSSGLEWLFRLIQEPRRLLMRYLTTNCRFAWLLLLEAISRRRPS